MPVETESAPVAVAENSEGRDSSSEHASDKPETSNARRAEKSIAKRIEDVDSSADSVIEEGRAFASNSGKSVDLDETTTVAVLQEAGTAEQTASVQQQIQTLRETTKTSLAEKLTALREGLSSRTREKERAESRASEEDIDDLERQVGIETPEDRLIEASLLVDRKFLEAAVVTDQEGAERMFGTEAWASWLEARAAAREYGQGQLTPGFIMSLHGTLMGRVNPDIAGVTRTVAEIGGDYKDIGKPIHLTTEQIQAIEDNPLLSFKQVGKDPTYGHIWYPSSPDSTDKLVEGMLADTCMWYNEQKQAGEDPHQLAAQLQRRFVSTHPFLDGTGRLSRLVMNWSLENSGKAPSILEDPSDDILVRPEVWEDKVREGSQRYAEIQNRKAEMKAAGVENRAELLGLDQERTFYHYIHSRIRRAPAAPKEGELMSHSAYEGYMQGLRAEMARFKAEFSADSSVITVKRDRPFKLSEEWGMVTDHEELKAHPEKYAGRETVHQGDLISRFYIEQASALAVGSTKYARGRFFQNTEVYRGGIAERRLGDQDLLQMFSRHSGLGAGYRALNESRVSATSSSEVSTKAITKSLEDYNAFIAQSYLARHHPRTLASRETLKLLKQELRKGRNPLRVVLDFARGRYFGDVASQHKFGKNINNSPFVSTSFDTRVAYTYSQKTQLAEKMGREASGILFESRLPAEGAVLGFSTIPNLPVEFLHYEQTGHTTLDKGERGGPHDIKGVKQKVYGGLYLSEVYTPAGVDPRSIDKISVYDSLTPPILPSRKYQGQTNFDQQMSRPSLVGERSFEGDAEYLDITDYRQNEEGIRRTYQRNKESGEFESVDTTEVETVAA